LAESDAILIYLADKTGQFVSSNARERAVTLQWIMFQMSGAVPLIYGSRCYARPDTGA